MKSPAKRYLNDIFHFSPTCGFGTSSTWTSELSSSCENNFAEEIQNNNFAEETQNNNFAEETQNNNFAEETQTNNFAEETQNNNFAEETRTNLFGCIVLSCATDVTASFHVQGLSRIKYVALTSDTGILDKYIVPGN